MSQQELVDLAVAATRIGGDALADTLRVLQWVPISIAFAATANDSTKERIKVPTNSETEFDAVSSDQLQQISLVLSGECSVQDDETWRKAEAEAWGLVERFPSSQEVHAAVAKLFANRADWLFSQMRANEAAVPTGVAHAFAQITDAPTPELIASYRRMGRLMIVGETPADAPRYFDLAVDAAVARCQEAQDDLDAQCLLGHATVDLARSLMEVNDFVTARAHLRMLQKKLKQLLAQPGDREALHLKASIELCLGQIDGHSNNIGEALPHLTSAAQSFFEEIAQYGESAEALEGLANARLNIYLYHDAVRNLDLSQPAALEAIAASKRLSEFCPGNLAHLDLHLRVLITNGSTEFERGNHAGALQRAQQIIEIATPHFQKEADSKPLATALSTAHVLASRAAQGLKDDARLSEHLEANIEYVSVLSRLSVGSTEARIEEIEAVRDYAIYLQVQGENASAIVRYSQAEELAENLSADRPWPSEEGIVARQALVQLRLALLASCPDAERRQWFDRAKEAYDGLPANHPVQKSFTKAFREAAKLYGFPWEEPPSLLGRLFGKRK